MSDIRLELTDWNPLDPTRLLVCLDGVQATGMRPGGQISKALQERHPLINSHYEGFNRRKFVYEIYAWICNHVGTVTFIGMSAGALLAHDVIEYAKSQGTKIERFEIILLDALTGLRDMVDQNAQVVPFLPPIPLPASINHRIFGSDDKIEHEEGLSETARAELDEHIRRSHNFSFRSWVQQVRYPVMHRGPRRDVLEGVDMVSIVSQEDKLVRQPGAHQHWEEAAGREIYQIAAESPGHCFILEYPTTYLNTILAALDHLEEMRRAAVQ